MSLFRLKIKKDNWLWNQLVPCKIMDNRKRIGIKTESPTAHIFSF